MYDVDGDRYLDAYNNVPCVGHAHPRVTEAIARQARVVNTNMRYLHAGRHRAGRAADRHLPARARHGALRQLRLRGQRPGLAAGHPCHRPPAALCTHFAYHGISEAIAPLSPEMLLRAAATSEHVERWHPADAYRGEHLDSTEFDAALARLDASAGSPPAAVILDGVMQSDGIQDLDPGVRRRRWSGVTHEAGGLWIADEVQGGHGRTGEAMWSFQRFGIEPDFVTLGKPMGNGHPVAAVITRREFARAVRRRDGRSSPPSAATRCRSPPRLAVLDVLARRAGAASGRQAAGEALRAAVREADRGRDRASATCAAWGWPTGSRSSPTRRPRSPTRTCHGREERPARRRVLVGTTGRQGNVLKVRPPLAFTDPEVPQFVEALRGSLVEAVGG